MRICSFLPSATEIVYALGLGDQLYGVTQSCDYPADARTKPRVVRSILDGQDLSSTEIDRIVIEHARRGESVYHIDMDALRRVEPDLILTQELCDVCAVGYQDVLAQTRSLPKVPQVLSLSPNTLEDIFQDMIRVGEATGSVARAHTAVSVLRRRVESVRQRAAQAAMRPRTFCLEWLDPLFLSGHWVSEMVEIAGGSDGLGDRYTASTRTTWERVCEYQPEVFVLMPCGFDVSRTLQELDSLRALPGWAELPAVQASQVYAVNGGAYYSRSGPRLVEGLEVLAQILHPELFPWKAPADAAMRVQGPGLRQEVPA